MTQLIAIIGTQRSGTTAVGTALGALPGSSYLGEIFHAVRGPHDDPDYRRLLVTPEANFFTFRERLFQALPQLSYPSLGNQRYIWTAYRSRLLAVPGMRRVIIDAKYNSLHHLNGVWHGPTMRPELLNILAGEGVPVLHLVRRDVFAQEVSRMLADRSGHWHHPSGHRAEPVSAISVDAQELDRRMASAAQGRNLVTNWLSDGIAHVELAYEKLFDEDGRITPRYGRRIASFLKTEQVGPEVPLNKVIRQPLRQLVANRKEVLAHFAKHRHRKLVERHLA